MKYTVLGLYSIIFLFFSCNKNKELENIDFRAEMVEFVSEISDYAKILNEDFLIIPQNGESLVENSLYILKIDGIGREDLNYGYEADGQRTPTNDYNEIILNLNKYTSNYKKVFITDYVFSNSEDEPHFDTGTLTKINYAYENSISNGYIPYATVRNLNFLTINPDHEPEEKTITGFDDVESFLYYLQPNNVSISEYINSIANTNFDLVIMDLTYDGLNEFSPDDIAQIKNGLNNGNGGYIVCYMSIGEAEDYRYYWNDNWIKDNGKISKDAPDWLYDENPDWEGNYKVMYWKSDWKEIIYGNSNSYLDKVISKGFDGVYMDIIDAYEYFEEIVE